MTRAFAFVVGLVAIAACGDAPYYLNIDAGLVDADPVDEDGGDVDANTDGGESPDGDPSIPRSYDVAYVDHWRLTGISGPAPFDAAGINVIVNSGSEPIDPTTFGIVSFQDDHSTAGVSFTVFSDIQNAALQPGQASGELTANVRALIIDSGMVTEQRVDTTTSYLAVHAGNMPAGDYVINASVTVRVQGKELQLPVQIDHQDGSYNITAVSARRVTAVLD